MFRAAFSVLSVLLSAGAATAQPRMIVSGGLGTVEVSLDTGATRALVRPANALGGVPVDGGRYLVTVVPQPNEALAIQAWAPRTGQTLTSSALPYVSADGSPALAGDSLRPRVFVWNRQTISVVTPDGVQPFVTGVNPFPATRHRVMAYAPVSQTLFVVRQGADVELAQYDADGTFIRATAMPGREPVSVVATSDGATVFVMSYSVAVLGPPQLRRYDAATGLEVGVVDLVSFDRFAGFRGLIMDEAHQRLLMATTSRLEARTFDFVLVNAFQTPDTQCRFDLGVDERTGIVLAATTQASYSYARGPRNPAVTAVDVVSGAIIGSVPLTNPAADTTFGEGPCGGGSVVLTPPLPPTMEAPTVAAGIVTLAWQPMRNTTDYQLEASIGGGATIFTTRTSGLPSLTVANVPPGVYTVRVRGVNDSGVGTPSEPVIVTVP
jgi:hypothetical protein